MLGRRQFARAVGTAALFSPFAAMVQPRRASGALGTARHLVIFHTTGTDLAQWTPVGSTPEAINFSPILEPLAPIADTLLVVDNLDSKGTASGHAAPGGLTGLGYGAQNAISLEQFVGDQLNQNGFTAFSSLILGGVSSEAQSTFYRDGKVLSPLFLPSAAFETVFASALGDDSVDPQARLLRRTSILDVVGGQLRDLQAQLGTEERAKLDLHAESLRQLEQRLELQTQGGDCSVLARPSDPGQALANSALHVEIAINAIACGLTDVVAVEFGHHQATPVDIPSAVGDWHGFLHSNLTDELIATERFVAEQFLLAAQRLQETPAPEGGSLYDHTVMIWTRGMGDAVIHAGNNMPYVLAGGAGGYLRQSPNGIYVDGGGEAHQRLLFNVCEALGIVDLAGFGSSDSNVGDREPLSLVRA